MNGLVSAMLLDLRRGGASLALATVGVAIGVAALGFFLALGRGIEHIVLDEMMARLPVNIVKIEPRTGVALGPLRFDAGGLLTPQIDDAAIATLQSVAGVKAVYPLLPALFPMRAQGGKAILGRDIYTDMFAVGVDPEFVADAVAAAHFTSPADDAVTAAIPVVVSSQLLNIYNRTVAPAIGAPRLSEQAIIGFRFEIVLGESYSVGQRGGSRRVPAHVVGVSPHVPLAGITVPRAVIEAWNRRYAADKRVSFAAAFVQLADSSALDDVVKRSDSLGLVVDDTARVVGTVIRAATALLALVAVLILVVASMHAAQTFEARTHTRRKEIALLRALGATRGNIAALFLGQAALIGCAGALLGLACGLGAALLVEQAAMGLLTSLPFTLEHIFVVDTAVVLIPACAAIVAAIVGAARPVWRITRLDPARILSGETL